jgi:uncharacterized protein (DUF1330 family)
MRPVPRLGRKPGAVPPRRAKRSRDSPANYTITNQAKYKEYLAAVGPGLKAHGAENIVVDRDSKLLEGSAGQVTVMLRFATKAAAEAWYESPEYQAIRHLRTDNTEGIGVIAEGK